MARRRSSVMTVLLVTTGSPAGALPGKAYRTTAIAANTPTRCFIGNAPARVERGEYRTARGFRLGGGRLALRLSAQCFAQVVEQLRELAGHHREVDVELLGLVDVAAIGDVLGHLQEFELLDLQFLGEHE